MAYRFVSYRSNSHSGAKRVGIVLGNDCTHVAPCIVSGRPVLELYDLIEDWEDVHDLIREGQPRELSSEVEILAPFVGRDVIGVAKNFRDHAKEMDKSSPQPAPEAPMMFTKRASSIIPTGATICIHPDATKSVDYEGEMAIIIGKPGRNIKKEDAWKHVWGATILNDVTARDLQKTHKQFYIGKSLDTFCPIGPFAVHSSQLDWDDMTLETRVNDEIRQKGKTNDLIFDIPTLVETCSNGITLQPGDIIATGTPAGGAAGLNPPPWLKPGDVVSVSVTGLGTLTNPVGNPTTACEPVRNRDIRRLDVDASSSDTITLSSGKTISYESRGPLNPQSKSSKKYPPIVFVHGTGVSSIGFYPLIEATGITVSHRVITFDADGNGRSPLSAPFDFSNKAAKQNAHIEAYAQDLYDLLAALKISEPVILVGHSKGALISQIFASKYTDLVAKLVFLSPASTTRPYSIPTLLSRAQEVHKASSLEGVISFLTTASLSRKTRKDPIIFPFASALIRTEYQLCKPQAYVRACVALANTTKPIDFLKVNERGIPTLIIVGTEDKFTPKDKDAECIRKKMKGSELRVLKDVGHWPHLEALEETSKLVLAFINSKNGGGVSAKL